MAKRQRVDSATAAVRIMGAATANILPPDHISVPSAAIPFWDAIMRGRARADWLAAPSLMNAAANLAWTQWQIDRCRRLIDGTDEDRDGLAVAQLASQLLKMQRLEMGYLRVLQQHGRGVDGEARDVAKRRAVGLAIEAGAPAEDEDLLARPIESMQ
jgi:hypothetical protein